MQMPEPFDKCLNFTFLLDSIMADWVFLNDLLVPQEAALLPFRDLSFQRGYGVFDFFRLVDGQPLFLDDHLERFYFSARELRLPVPFAPPQLKEVLSDLLARNNRPNAGIRLSLTGGLSEDGFSVGKPNFLISQHDFSLPTPSQVRAGVSLLTYAYRRQLPHVKSIDYLTAIYLQPTLKENDADDLLYHHNGSISECPRSNFFLVTRDDRIVTPSDNRLAGVTRKKVIQLAAKDFPVEERAVTLPEIREAKEAFITSTTRQILPVGRIDDVVFGQTGIARHLLQAFQAACRETQRGADAR